jgi:histidinol phosphatase-like enzyme (inositol monophosphatase family)
LARDWIAERFPDDGIVGEEFGMTRPDARRRWIIDPIDATKSFIRTVPLWGTLIAVVEDDEVIAGAAYYPAITELLVAAPGQGCWWNGRRSHVSETSSLEHATIVTTDDRFAERPERRMRWQELAGRTGITRTWGDCFGYFALATGAADLMLDPTLAYWDVAAIVPVVEGAGGVVTSWTGASPLAEPSLIASAGPLNEVALDLLRQG